MSYIQNPGSRKKQLTYKKSNYSHSKIVKADKYAFRVLYWLYFLVLEFKSTAI